MTSAPLPLPPAPPPRLALVGDRSDEVRAHARIPEIVAALSDNGDEPIEAYWLHSSSISGPADVAGFDGIWVVPGSPYADPDGVIVAIQAARTAEIPLLGTCGGFQHLLLEYARSVCGLAGVGNAETDPGGGEMLIVPLACSLLGEEAGVTVQAGTVAARAMGAGASTERFFCRYGLDVGYLGVLEDHGLVVSGRDDAGEPRIVELPGHPWYVGALFQPELSSDPTWVHPLIVAFGAAVRARARVAHGLRVADPAGSAA